MKRLRLKNYDWNDSVAISYVIAKIKSRHFCSNSECRLFCRPKMCYNIFKEEVLFKEVEI